jgi:hypothetical protein
MMKKLRLNLSIALASLVICSCASTHPGLRAENEGVGAYKDLNVSSYFRRDLSDPTNFYYEVTFENKGNQWIRIDEIDIDFPPNSGGPYNLIKGADLATWAESLKLKSQTKNFSEGILVAGAILGGLTMAAIGDTRGDIGLKSAGAVIVGAGAAYSVTKAFKGDGNKDQAGHQLPDNHLFKPFVIPSNGLVRKWILWSVPSGKISQHATLKLKTIEDEQFAYRIRFWEK